MRTLRILKYYDLTTFKRFFSYDCLVNITFNRLFGALDFVIFQVKLGTVGNMRQI